MEKKQINKELQEYAKLNAKSIIDTLVKLYEYQENIKIDYSIKLKN